MSLFFILVLGLSGWVQASVPEQVEKPKSTVFARKVKLSEISDLLIYPAKVIPQMNTMVLAESDGIVTKILAPLGQSIGRHQSLMVLSHTDPIYQYAPMTVKAPISGVVSSVEVSEGSQVSKGDRLASVTDPKKIRISIEIPAQDLSMVAKGMAGEFKAMGGTEATGVKIRGISPFVDPATGTATCEIELVDASKALSPGLLGQVTFKANEHSGVSIPDYALFYKGSDVYVRVVDGEKAKHVPVTLGKRQRGYVEIVKGLSPDQLVVERASRYVGDDETVTVERAAQD